MTLAGLGILLLLAPFQIILGTGNRGNCSYLKNTTFDLVCHSSVTADLFGLYRDNRAPKGTPYSVWQSGDVNDSDSQVLVSFHDDFLHTFKTLQIENYAPEDGHHTFLVKTAVEIRRIDFQPSLLHCFRIRLRYPMELRSHCLGAGRSMDVAQKPALFYAMDDINPSKKDGDARTVIPFGALFILVSSLLVVFS